MRMSTKITIWITGIVFVIFFLINSIWGLFALGMIICGGSLIIFLQNSLGEKHMNLKKRSTQITIWAIGVFFVFFLISSICGLIALGRVYSVWSAGKTGQAELQQADWNRQIAVREAHAKEESAILLAQAEVERAKGVAKANKIIGDSLRNNEAYLRYLWIDNLQNDKNQVIYVPTEANLPILEASRFKHKK